tara:strand:- start:677 stop:1690 length:1014 start_codon:yes stop_codon:yes gene_type:complete
MKRLLLFLIIPFLSFGQDLTYVPDDGFELLIETVIPNASNGIENDNYVVTSALDADINTDWNGSFVINNVLAPVFDLTGFEDFKNLILFSINNTYVSNIDLSGVTFKTNSSINVMLYNQYLESIILPEDTIGSVLIQPGEGFSNIVFNPNFCFDTFYLLGPVGAENNLCEVIVEGKIVDVVNASSFIRFDYCGLSSIDLSGISEAPYQTGFFVQEESSILSQINLNNPVSFYNWGSGGIGGIGVADWNLDNVCIELSSQLAVDFCSNDIGWPQENTNYSTSCFNPNFNCSSINISEATTLNKTLIKTLDILGREATNKCFQLHIYDDGSVEKKYLIK